MSKPTPSTVNFAAPRRLRKALEALGYDVELKITRSADAVLPSDPGSDPGPVDAPITDDDEAHIKATLKAYEATDKPPKGEKFKAPRK